MWLKCQLCRTIALNLVLSEKKRKSELELDRKVPNSTFWTRGLAANPDNLSNPALIIPSLEHSIVIEARPPDWTDFRNVAPFSSFSAGSSQLWYICRISAARKKSALTVRLAHRRKNLSAGNYCQLESANVLLWKSKKVSWTNPSLQGLSLLGGIIMLNLYRSCNGARESLFSRQVCNRWTPQTYLRRKERGEHLFAG